MLKPLAAVLGLALSLLVAPPALASAATEPVPATSTACPSWTRHPVASMALDRAQQLLHVASTFTPTTTISTVDVRRPEVAPRVITLPGLGPLNSADDLTLGADGFLYVPLNVAGKVVRVDPDSGAACTVATGLPFVSSVRFGAGAGWDPRSLYAVTFAGSVIRLTPG